MFFPADVRTVDTSRHDAQRTSAADPPAPAIPAAHRGVSRRRAMGVAGRHAGAAPDRERPRLPQRTRRRLGDGGRTRHRARPLLARTRLRPRPLVRHRQPRARRPGRRRARRRSRVADRHAGAQRLDPASALPCVDRRRRGQRAGRRRSRTWHRGLRPVGARLEAPAGRRAGLRLRREDRPIEQARAAARRLQLHDVEQRHLRLRERHRSDLRVGPVLPRAARRADARHLSRQHLPQQLRRRPHVAGPAVVRRGRRRARLLLHLRARPEARHPALHRA